MHVFLFHSAWRTGTRFDQVIKYGTSGVSLFFVLSGFIIGYAYLDESTPVDRVAFWRARIARVIPVYLLGVLAGLPYFIARQSEVGWPSGKVLPAVTVGLTAVLAQAWNPSTACQVNCVGWSLSVETCFYILFPFIAAGVLRDTPARALRSAALLWISSLLFAAIWIRGNGAAYFYVNAYFHGGSARLFTYFPLIRLPELLLGLSVGRWFLAQRTALEAQRREWGWVAATSLIGIVGLSMIWPIWLWPFMQNGLLAPLYAMLIIGLAVGEGRLVELLSSRIAVALGAWSYAMYILHVPISLGYDWLAKQISLPSQLSFPGVLFRLLVTLGICAGVFAFIEEPLRRRIVRGGGR